MPKACPNGVDLTSRDRMACRGATTSPHHVAERVHYIPGHHSTRRLHASRPIRQPLMPLVQNSVAPRLRRVVCIAFWAQTVRLRLTACTQLTGHVVAPRQTRRPTGKTASGKTEKAAGKSFGSAGGCIAVRSASGGVQAPGTRDGGLSFGVPGAVDGFEFALANHFETCHIGCGGGSVVN